MREADRDRGGDKKNTERDIAMRWIQRETQAKGMDTGTEEGTTEGDDEDRGREGRQRTCKATGGGVSSSKRPPEGRGGHQVVYCTLQCPYNPEEKGLDKLLVQSIE